MTTTKEDLLTPNETAAFLGISEGTLMVWRCVRRYPLNFIKVGGKVRYRRQDVERFLQERTVKCGPEAFRKRRACPCIVGAHPGKKKAVA